MGAKRQRRALTLFAVVLLVLAPSIAVAKTLEGTKTGSEPLAGAVSGPPSTGTVAPMIVPPSTVAGSVSLSGAVGSDASEKDDETDVSAAERAGEFDLPSDPAGTSPARSTPSAGENPPTAISSVEPGNAGSNPASPRTMPATMPSGVPRQAGPSIPFPLGANARPAALALRDRVASAGLVDPNATAVAGIDPNATAVDPTGTPTATSAPPSLRGETPPQGAGSFVSCATLPSPGTSNDRIVWRSERTAEITAGRDLRPAEQVSGLPGTSVIVDPSFPVEAYLLHPNTFAVMARFTVSNRGSDELVGFLDQPLPGLQISECDGRPAPGIAPGTYLLRYAFRGTVASASTVASENFMSPPVSVRVIAGPTAPTLAATPVR